MKFKSALVTQASGSVGGFTAAHNRGGLYLRGRTIPTNPATSQQVVMRNIIASLVSQFVTALTPTGRTQYGIIADNVEIAGKLGDPIKLSAINWWVRENANRLQNGLPLLIEPVTDLPDFNFLLAPTGVIAAASVTAATGIASITFDNTQPWAAGDNGYLGIYASRPQSPGIEYFAGPYQLAGTVLGDTATPPTSPVAVTLPFPVAVGQKVFFQARAQGGGLLSSPFRFSGVGI